MPVPKNIFASIKRGLNLKQARGREKQLSRVERLETVQSNKSMLLQMQDVAGSGEVVLEIRDLSMSYPDKVLFHGVTETIYKGEKVGLIGGNGVGKSTILKNYYGTANAQRRYCTFRLAG